MALRFCAGVFSMSMEPRADGPTAILSMYVSGAFRRFPLSAIAITLSAFGPPVAVMVVPSSGSSAMSTSGSAASPFPTFSPMYSIGASSRSPSPMTMVPRMLSWLNALRIASTAAWSARCSSPRPITRAEAIDAASVSRMASRPMFLSIANPLQRLEQPVRRPGRLAVLADADMHGMPQREHGVIPHAVDLVLETNLDARVGDDHAHLDQVVVARRRKVLRGCFVDRQHDPARFDVPIGNADPADPLV